MGSGLFLDGAAIKISQILLHFSPQPVTIWTVGGGLCRERRAMAMSEEYGPDFVSVTDDEEELNAVYEQFMEELFEDDEEE